MTEKKPPLAAKTLAATTRTEHDSIGAIEVPSDAKYGAQTQRAVENFQISGRPIPNEVIVALAQIKLAAAAANEDFGVIEHKVAAAIRAAAREVIEGKHAGQFPVDVYQTGSGTSTNMNLNEVLAHLATESLGTPVHPNDQVNASQSSNDTFPSAVQLASVAAIESNLIPALQHLAEALDAKAREFAFVVKAGRTHLMDATPVTLGQEFSGYASQIRLGVDRLTDTLPRIAALPLGGTAVGTGINTPAGFTAAVIESLNAETGLGLTEASNHFEAQGARDALVEVSGVLKTIAVGLIKIANDIRWMGSGPTAGLGEIHLPDLQPGSSIMPGKVNPVIPESVLQVCSRVIGNDATVTWAGASGNFELNVQVPVMADAILESIRLMANVSIAFADKAIAGITANAERALGYAESSPAIVTPLNRLIGYDLAAKVAKHAVNEGLTIRESVIALGLIKDGAITEEALDEALNVMRMTRPTGE